MKPQAIFPFAATSGDASIWVTEFSDLHLKKFADQFFKLESDPSIEVIPVFITSYGGDVHNMLAMRDIIKSSNKQVATIAIGKAMSAGAALLAAGSKGLRFASKDTTIMIHEVSSGAWGKTEDLKVSATEVDRLNKVFLKNMADDIGITFTQLSDKLHSMKNADWFLTAQEALELKLIDDIQMPRMAEEVTSKTLIAFQRNAPKQVAKKNKPKSKKK